MKIISITTFSLKTISIKILNTITVSIAVVLIIATIYPIMLSRSMLSVVIQSVIMLGGLEKSCDTKTIQNLQGYDTTELQTLNFLTFFVLICMNLFSI
jgi:hypothetical protein